MERESYLKLQDGFKCVFLYDHCLKILFLMSETKVLNWLHSFSSQPQAPYLETLSVEFLLCLKPPPLFKYFLLSFIVFFVTGSAIFPFQHVYSFSLLQALNLILLTSSELSGLRDLLKKSLVHAAGKDLFVSLYASWCHSPMAIISLCLLAQVGFE